MLKKMKSRSGGGTSQSKGLAPLSTTADGGSGAGTGVGPPSNVDGLITACFSRPCLLNIVVFVGGVMVGVFLSPNQANNSLGSPQILRGNCDKFNTRLDSNHSHLKNHPHWDALVGFPSKKNERIDNNNDDQSSNKLRKIFHDSTLSAPFQLIQPSVITTPAVNPSQSSFSAPLVSSSSPSSLNVMDWDIHLGFVSPFIDPSSLLRSNQAKNQSLLTKHSSMDIDPEAWFHALIPQSLIDENDRWNQVYNHLNDGDPNQRRSKWKKGRDFPITETMMRQSRAVIGRMDRLHNILRLLIEDRRCLTILAVGASVTAGKNAGGPSGSYAARLQEWLNAKYPCIPTEEDLKELKQSKHIVVNHGWRYGGTSIKEAVQNFYGCFGLHKLKYIDIVLVEFQVNDGFVKDWGLRDIINSEENNNNNNKKNKKTWKKQTKDTLFERIQWLSEVLIRRVLLLDKSRAKDGRIAPIFFEADWRLPNRFRNEPPITRGFVSLARLPLSHYYGIPMINIGDIFAHFTLANNEYDRTRYYSMVNWHSDRCCHPRYEGHVLLAVTLAYNLEMEISWIQSQAYENAFEEIEKDFSKVNDLNSLYKPWIMTEEEDSILVGHWQSETNIDFMSIEDSKDPNNYDRNACLIHPEWFGNMMIDKKSDDSMNANNDTNAASVAHCAYDSSVWQWYNDSQSKYGLIAQGNHSQYSHISFKVSVNHVGLINMIYLKSYDDSFGEFVLWVDHNPEYNSINDHPSSSFAKNICRDVDRMRTLQKKTLDEINHDLNEMYNKNRSIPVMNLQLYSTQDRSEKVSISEVIFVKTPTSNEPTYLHLCKPDNKKVKIQVIMSQ